MNVYFVLSEELGGCYRICHIVRARTRSQAKYLAWKTDDRSSGSYVPGEVPEMPRFSVRKLGLSILSTGVLSGREAAPWWRKVPEDA